jgi:hypothetical protein
MAQSGSAVRDFQLMGTDLVNVVLDGLSASAATFWTAMGALDRRQTGTISRPEFRKVVEHLVFRLTDEQFNNLVDHLGCAHTLISGLVACLCVCVCVCV